MHQLCHLIHQLLQLLPLPSLLLQQLLYPLRLAQLDSLQGHQAFTQQLLQLVVLHLVVPAAAAVALW